MNDELYELWKQRARAEAPADFADRVMDAVRREAEASKTTPTQTPPFARGGRMRLLSSPAVRVAACVVACLAFLYRLAAVVAVFFVS